MPFGASNPLFFQKLNPFWISENSNAVKNDRVEEDAFPPSLLAMPAPRERLHGGVTGGFVTVS